MLDFQQIHKNDNSWFLWVLKGIVIVGFLIMIGRLLDLQIVRGAYFKSLAEDNRVRRIPIYAPRGSIYDRDGQILVESKKQGNPEESYKDAKDIIVPWSREYKRGEALGHVTGYLGFAKEDEVGKVRGNCPEKGTRKIGSFVGRSGLEETYDCILSGIDGEELVEVDAMGRAVRTLGRREPQKGEDIRTTIDYGLQKKIAEVMKDKKGAVVALNPKGEVLALYSAPSYDPGIFVTKDNQENVVNVLNDQNQPLFNRAIAGTFHPGSVYKPVIALAALSENAITKDYTYNDKGRIVVESNYGNFTFNNWYYTQYGGQEGDITVKRALARSTDTFFYEIGNLLGVDKINEWSGIFNLNEKTGIDLPGEIAGLIPSKEWKKKVKNEPWYLGDTYNISIGQGDVAVTPLAMGSAISAIASDGEWCRPTVVQGTACKKIPLEKSFLQEVKDGMYQACQQGGTAYPFFDFQIRVACKTGTAETDTGDETHAWFTVFGPYEENAKPEIILTVLVEKGGEGSKVAAPIAREIFNYWFYEKKGLELPQKQLPATSRVISPSVTPTPLPGTAE